MYYKEKNMNKKRKLVSAVISFAAFTLPAIALADGFTIQLSDGVSSACSIMTQSPSRIVLTQCKEVKVGIFKKTQCNYNTSKIVNLSSFTHSGNTYTYNWTDTSFNSVAIQVDLTNYSSPNVWNGSCVYAPMYNAGIGHTTFAQQYTEPDSAYTCACGEQGWVAE